VRFRGAIAPSTRERLTPATPLATAILAGAAFVTLIQAIVGYYGAYRASVRIHDNMLETVIRSTSRWVSPLIHTA
jgi:hypothetical protein